MPEELPYLQEPTNANSDYEGVPARYFLESGQDVKGSH